MIVTKKNDSLKVFDTLRSNQVSMAIFCTASHWNTEAILLAASRYAKKHDIEMLPIAVAMTFNYPYMPQAQRVTKAGFANEGFISVMKHLDTLCSAKDSSYSNVMVLPHLDHANPVKDKWALTEGTQYLATAMFDAQTYPYEENIALTKEYVKEYGNNILIEGIMDELTVSGMHTGKAGDSYVERATRYIKETNIDFLVADLGTEQQTSSVGKCVYLQDRAKELTSALGTQKLVLHGTSCLSNDQMTSLPYDGIIRVNMWTRIVREACQFAAKNLVDRYGKIEAGEFEACDTKAYLDDCTEKAAQIMEEILDILGTTRLSGKKIL